MERSVQYSDNDYIVQQVLSKFSFALLFMTVGMVIGALLVPPAIASMMPFLCMFVLLGAFMVRRGQRSESGMVTYSMSFVYGFAALMGVGIYPSVLYYTQAIGANLVMTALGVTFVVFFGLSFYASHTKRNFLNLGSVLFGGLVALILVSLVGLFIHATALQITVTVGGLFIFSGYVLYDVQLMRSGLLTEEDVPMMVLNLFLDFVNLFLYILRMLGFLASND